MKGGILPLRRAEPMRCAAALGLYVLGYGMQIQRFACDAPISPREITVQLVHDRHRVHSAEERIRDIDDEDSPCSHRSAGRSEQM
jgi:hypothetical protein